MWPIMLTVRHNALPARDRVKKISHRLLSADQRRRATLLTWHRESRDLLPEISDLMKTSRRPLSIYCSMIVALLRHPLSDKDKKLQRTAPATKYNEHYDHFNGPMTPYFHIECTNVFPPIFPLLYIVVNDRSLFMEEMFFFLQYSNPFTFSRSETT